MKEIKISPEFKTRTTQAVLSIALFVLTYLLMLFLAVGLTVVCVYLGIMLIAFKPTFITIALGIGLASLGILVLFFLIKFMFKSHKVDLSHLTEIEQADEPKLFKMIDDIVEEVGTNFPKKVYLSSDVNAAVFYDSSFWSMFFPIKKNLQIGLGLVNTVTQSELKAILSHEFGHFSQKTMKVGSYVYNVNQVIFNLLYDNESYDNLMQKWSNTSSYFSIFVIIAIKIVEGIKWVLKQIYGVVNKSYMALSREMEFHADEIAASVTGYQPLKNALLRLSLADHSLGTVLSFYDRKIVDNEKSENIYKDHLYVTNFLAQESNIEIKNNLPQITANDLNKFNKSKLIVKDQWASHPSTEDRIIMLEKTGFSNTNLNNEPSNQLFTDIEKTQTALTQKIFNNVVYSGECSVVPFEMFQKNFKEDYFQNTFSKVYNGYYDNKNPLFFDVENIGQSTNNAELEDLFSESKVEEVYTALSLQTDIESIKQISDKASDVKTFDYDGIKYSKKDCKGLISKLEKELEIINEHIKINDIEIFKYFRSQEQKANLNPSLKDLYNQYFNYDKDFDDKYDVYIQLSNELQFVNYTTPIEQIRANFIKIEPLEYRLKKEIAQILKNEDFQTEITKEIKDNFDLYLTQKLQYFGKEKYFDNNLEILFSVINNYAFLLSRGYFLMKQKLLNYQVELLKTTQNSVHTFTYNK
jgi:Zn-dependent protease with chaperone function